MLAVSSPRCFMGGFIAQDRAGDKRRRSHSRTLLVLCGQHRRTPMPLTQDLGRFVSGLGFEKLPAEAVSTARTGIIDTIATMVAGAHDPAPQLLRKGLEPAKGPASLYFSGESATAPEAAWINGTAGHALDYDDVG